ncbi:DUF1800 domain-containing protein [Pseudoalteromonas rubra]|uniref:DUF1800 domain-containing protein n=1 Tax=Pseudoalteromonas rubra TaxID=43658 RepID=A0A5S3WGC4_9GAMM|nr:DUF1800 domain-containing protein [Pseudoalteromonas rubra]TMP25809.1 DUF1800 domain-containing protein [Pseudoalteromonas rubra]TMP34995.1 DUF1800 domain-containing protein [Pseudoalteromonas rubra]
MNAHLGLVALCLTTLVACGGGSSDSGGATDNNSSNTKTNANNGQQPSGGTDSPSDDNSGGAVDPSGDQGEGGGDSEPQNAPPEVEVSIVQPEIVKGAPLTLSANVADPQDTSFSYLWKQLTGPTVELGDVTGPILTVTLPETYQAQGDNYQFSVTVTDAQGAETTTEIEVYASNAMSDIQAAMLLHQGTMGPTLEEVNAATGMSEEQWLADQMALPATYHSPLLENYPDRDTPYQINRIDAWWKASLHADDQLRQRVAFALSEIFVVSDANNALKGEPEGMLAYYDLLLEHAFGNYRSLLEAVTLSPVMGTYLSHLGNEKADPERNIRPDENYAREVMQLFTIGLEMLNQDGTVKLDEGNQPIATYSQQEITGFARVFTGWTFAFSARWNRPSRNFSLPMQAFPEYHSALEKTLLNGVVIPAGVGPEESMQMALDNLFNHPNVGPFISKQLIQRLITSNPSAQYVERVAEVFNDNGNGVRGDLSAVVRAIYLDDEARRYGSVLTYQGKIKEPLLKGVQMWRTLNAHSEEGNYFTWNLDDRYGQGPMLSPSVFNFFRPDHQPAELSAQGLFAPELQIANDAAMIGTLNQQYSDLIWRMAERHTTLNPSAIYLYGHSDITLLELNGLSALLNRYNVLYFAGNMSESTRNALIELDEYFSNKSAADRVGQLLFMVSLSPEFNVQY